MFRSDRQWYVCLGLALALSSCFYDSSWGQRRAMQKHEVERQTPGQVRGQSLKRSARVAERSLRLRVYATPAHEKRVVHWQKQFEQALACANSVFTAEFGAQFEVAEFREFQPQAGEEKLDGLLAELTRLDSGADVDWVVGLATDIPLFAASADDLGLAPLLGNHLVMRAMSDAKEYEAIQSELTQISEDERRDLYQARKKHKWCSVFLHEVAHTLGVPHERPQSSLMNTRYHVKSQGFSPAATAILSASLDVRKDRPAVFLEPDFARLLSSSLSAPDNDWEPNSRDSLQRQLASFRNSAAGASGAVAQGTPKTGAAVAPEVTKGATSRDAVSSLAGLTPSEQRTYDQARAEFVAGHAAAARSIAAALFTQHADLPVVQSLRCDLAMAIGGDPETLDAECRGFSPFSTPQ